MANAVKPIPQGYHTITPALTCKNASQAIKFYKKAFGAKEKFRMEGPGGGAFTNGSNGVNPFVFVPAGEAGGVVASKEVLACT